MNKLWIAIALWACFAFAACGDGGGGSTGQSSSAGGNATPEEIVASVVGTWKLDNATVVAAVEKRLAEEPDPMGELTLEIARTMNAELVVKENGTFKGTVKKPSPLDGDENTETIKGAWTLEGDQFTFVTEEKNGVARETPDPASATFKDCVITVPTRDESRMDLVFRKK